MWARCVGGGLGRAGRHATEVPELARLGCGLARLGCGLPVLGRAGTAPAAAPAGASAVGHGVRVADWSAGG